MSTNSTIASGPTFHFYQELWDEDAVYLELADVHFEATYNQVVVPIPAHIWEYIRAFAGVDLSLVNWSDDELRAEVTRRVDERLARAAETGPHAVVRLIGAGVYGDVDAPRESQIERGVHHYKQVRAHQREIIAAIEELRRLNHAPGEGPHGLQAELATTRAAEGHPAGEDGGEGGDG